MVSPVVQNISTTTGEMDPQINAEPNCFIIQISNYWYLLIGVFTLSQVPVDVNFTFLLAFGIFH